MSVAEVQTHIFNTFVSSTNALVSSTINMFVFLFGSWLRNPPKKIETRKKTFLQNLISTRDMDLKKVQIQGRDERMQEDYPTSAVYFCRCRIFFLHSFISALFLCFFRSIPT